MTDLFADGELIASAALRHLATLPIGEALSPQDREDLAYEAYARMLERSAKGETIRHPIAYAQHAASNLAQNHVNRSARRFEDPTDPTEVGFGAGTQTPDPETAMFAHVDLVQVAAAVETMPRELQAVYRLRVTEPRPTTKEIATRLGIGHSTAKKRLKGAIEHLRSALVPDGASPAVVASYKLLNAYYSGIATARQRRAAELLLETDPAMRAHYRGLGRAHRAAGAMIPPVAAPATDPGLFDRIAGAVASARDGISSVLSRSSSETSQVASNLVGSGMGRGAGGVGAALLTKLGLGGQAALACLAGGGAVVACVATGLLPAPDLLGRGETERPTIAHSEVAPDNPARSLSAIAAASRLPSDVGNIGTPAQSKGTRTKARSAPHDRGSASTPTSEPVVDDTAAPVQQEFGVPGAATPVGGAPPDTNDSNGAAASTVRGEFGP